MLARCGPKRSLCVRALTHRRSISSARRGVPILIRRASRAGNATRLSRRTPPRFFSLSRWGRNFSIRLVRSQVACGLAEAPAGARRFVQWPWNQKIRVFRRPAAGYRPRAVDLATALVGPGFLAAGTSRGVERAG